MSLEMGYICSCGQTWVVSDWAAIESHIGVNTSHVVTEGYYHHTSTPVPEQVPVKAPNGSIYWVEVDAAGGVSSGNASSGQATKLPKSNLNATTDPGVGTDATGGYEVGSRWINKSTDK